MPEMYNPVWTAASTSDRDVSVWYSSSTTASTADNIYIQGYTCSDYTYTNDGYSRWTAIPQEYQPPPYQPPPVETWRPEEGVHFEPPVARLTKTPAQEKAEKLLLSILTKEERKEYLADKSITLESLGKKYEIIKGRVQNIYELDENGNRSAVLCAHVDPTIPDEDNLIAQVLALKSCPELLLSVANRRAI